MMRTLTLAWIVISAGALAATPAATRPKITGIDHVAFYTTDAPANEHLYNAALGLSLADPLETNQTQRFLVGAQWVGYSPAPDPKATDRMDHIAFRTDDCAALLGYLAA